MIIILLSVSLVDYNDPIVPGLTAYTVSAALGKEPFMFARFLIEDNCLELMDRDLNVKKLITPKKNGKQSDRSAQFECISQFLDEMKDGDQLKAVYLSDLGKTYSEAAELYFSFLGKGISLSFHDAAHLNTSLLNLKKIPSGDLKELFTRQIECYYKASDKNSSLTKKEMKQLAAMDKSGKKYSELVYSITHN